MLNKVKFLAVLPILPVNVLAQTTFTKITTGPVVTDSRLSGGSSWVDYDNDGDIDLFVVSPTENSLYENDGDGTFTRISEGAIVNDSAESVGCTWGIMITMATWTFSW